MARSALLLMALVCAGAARAQNTPPLNLHPAPVEPELKLGGSTFTLPVIDYRSPDGTEKRGRGIIIGRDITPNTTVGIGLFKTKPKYQDSTQTSLAGKSQKVALGISVRF